MQINKTENVIYLNDLESNIIEQAFIILKDNVKLNLNSEKAGKRNKEKVSIIKDAENLINYEIEKSNIKFEKFKNDILSRKIKLLKFSNIITVILLIVVILIK